MPRRSKHSEIVSLGISITYFVVMFLFFIYVGLAALKLVMWLV